MKEINLHRPLDGKLDLCRTLSKYEERTTRNDLTFQFRNIHYKILESQLCGKKIEVRTDWDGNMMIYQKDKKLKFTTLDNIYAKEKTHLIWKDKHGVHPNPNHPWKAFSYQRRLKERGLKCAIAL